MISINALAKLAAIKTACLEKQAFNPITTPITASTQLAQGINKQFPVQDVNPQRINRQGQQLHTELTTRIPYNARLNQWYSKQFNQNAKSNFDELLENNYQKYLKNPVPDHPYLELGRIANPGYYASYRAANPRWGFDPENPQREKVFANRSTGLAYDKMKSPYPTYAQLQNAYLNPNYYGYGDTRYSTTLTPNQNYLFNMLSVNKPLTEFATNSANNLARFVYPIEKPNTFAQLAHDVDNGSMADRLPQTPAAANSYNRFLHNQIEDLRDRAESNLSAAPADNPARAWINRHIEQDKIKEMRAKKLFQ